MHMTLRHDPEMRALFAEYLERCREMERSAQISAASQELSQIQAKMTQSKSKSLSGSYLEALGLGRPSKQGGRARSLTSK